MVRKSQIRKSHKYMVSKTQNCKLPHLRKFANLNKILVRKFADLRFAELSCGPPTSGVLNDDVVYSDLRSELRDRNTFNRQNTPIRNTK